MYGILRLVRIRTLLFAAFVMYAMRYFVIRPILEINDFTLQMPARAFTLLVVSVCCLIAGAYVINDYFDTKADRISAVKDVVVGRRISRRSAMTLHSVLNILSVGIAFYLGFAVGVWKIGILFLLVSGLLWFYSSSYKRYFLVGNFLVGLLAALIPVSVLIFEIPLLNAEYSSILIETDTNFMYLFNWILGFSYFLFLTTLIYEINKDIYTMAGDMEKGVRSVPLKWGIPATKALIAGLTIVCLVSAGWLYVRVFSDSLLILLYMLLGICLPYLVYLFCLGIKSGRRALQLGLIRLILVSGISFSFLLHHFFSIVFAE